MKAHRASAVFCAIAIVAALVLPSMASGTDKININTASFAELIQLERIGRELAAKIIEYRENNGPFEKPADIMKVKGIGPKTWELNKDRIVVE
jgi:competence protein ComEA